MNFNDCQMRRVFLHTMDKRGKKPCEKLFTEVEFYLFVLCYKHQNTYFLLSVVILIKSYFWHLLRLFYISRAKVLVMSYLVPQPQVSSALKW